MEFSVSDLIDIDDGTVKCFFLFCIPSNSIVVPAIPHLCQHNILYHFIKKKKVSSFTNEMSNKNLDLKVGIFHFLVGKLLNS